jgi:predicted ABC-type ATPase
MMLPADLKILKSFDRDKSRAKFAANLAAEGTNLTDIPSRSTGMMEDELMSAMRLAIKERNHFVLETPLSHPDHWKYIDLFENNGYQVQLNYLGLNKVGDCKARVAKRVIEGGHHVDADTIKGVFEKNLEFINAYLGTFQLIELYDGMKIPTLLVSMEHDQIVYADALALKKEWIKNGLPNISQKLYKYLRDQKG